MAQDRPGGAGERRNGPPSGPDPGIIQGSTKSAAPRWIAHLSTGSRTCKTMLEPRRHQWVHPGPLAQEAYLAPRSVPSLGPLPGSRSPPLSQPRSLEWTRQETPTLLSIYIGRPARPPFPQREGAASIHGSLGATAGDRGAASTGMDCNGDTYAIMPSRVAPRWEPKPPARAR